MKAEISIIIPTYNRLPTLKKCLEAILNNDFDRHFEVIIIDDGSTDSTHEEINSFIRGKKLNNFYIFRQKNSGPSKARNLGIKKARANIILIIGDDSIASPNLLKEHYIWNTERYPEENIAILGYSDWSPEIKITPFMHWINKAHLQFSYFRFTDENSPQWSDLWTCNISLKKSFLMKYGLFDEDFPYAAWEDVELGWRLRKHNFQIKYNREAVVRHYHSTTFESAKRRMFYYGYSQKILEEKMGKENFWKQYSNNLTRQPQKFLINLADIIISCSGILWILDKLANFLEKRRIIPLIFYPVLYHHKLMGNKKYEKTKNCNR